MQKQEKGYKKNVFQNLISMLFPMELFKWVKETH